MSALSEPRTSVIVCAHARADDLRACLESLRAQSDPRFEVLVVLDRPTDAVRAVVANASEADERVRQVPFAGGSPSQARNAAVARSRCEAVYFLDDDVLAPPEALATLHREMDAHPEASIFGGPNLTPPDDPEVAQITGALLSSGWGSAIARRRYRRAPAGPARERDLILCNLAARRELFRRGLSFPALFGGEENTLMGHAEREGFGLRYCPELWVHHRRRRTVRGYLSQLYRYGRGRANAIFAAPRTAHPVYLAPSLFVLYLLALPALAWLSPLVWLPLLVYAAGTTVASAVMAARRPRWFLPLLALFPATHIAYGLGVAVQLVRLVAGRGPMPAAEPR